MMGARSILHCVSALIFTLAGWAGSVYAGTVHIYGGDFNLPIPQQPDTSKGWMADAIINIPDHYVISDLDIEVNITHSNVFDLQMFLISPKGTIACLNMYNVNDFFIGPNYTQTIFDDEALVPIEQGEAPFTGRFRPKESLNIFDGEDTFGPWQLHICDAFDYDTGTLDSFELIISVPEPATILFLALGAVFIKRLRFH
ncbi:hypothetical protein ES703_81255 [subsurface metagenome]